MSVPTLSLEQALEQRDRGALLIDARTPAEFADGTIPGAINVSIFDDEERARVGTLYKEQGKAAARLLGVDLVAPKLPQMIRRVQAIMARYQPPVIVFCWRGGMRSRAMASLLGLAGVPARQMEGGHKAFRRQVLAFFERGAWARMLVLRGLTGVGKTRLLQQMARRGHPVLDLEALAGHRGSAFGGIGLGDQPRQKMFEALLWDALRQIPPDGYVLTEGESRHIGRLILPAKVYESLQTETSLWIEASLDRRVDLILDDYPAIAARKEEFAAPLRALKARLGAKEVNRLLELLADEAWPELVRELMVGYYDPLYRHSKPEDRIEVPIETEAEGLARLEEAVARILKTPRST